MNGLNSVHTMLKMYGCLRMWNSFMRSGTASCRNVSSSFENEGDRPRTCLSDKPSKSITITTPLIWVAGSSWATRCTR